MTLLETQVEDMLKNGIYSVMPEYVYYKDRTRLEFLPNGTKRNRLKKDNAMEHLERYFSPYLRYFTPSLTEQGEEPLYMFQLRHIDSNLARALIDFSDMHPDLLKSTSTVVPSKQQSGDKLLRNLTLILTLNPLEARRVSTRNNLQHRRSN